MNDPAAPARLFDELEGRLGRFTALVAAHCRDVELPLLGTSAEEFDRHFAVNARSVALLVQELARRLPGDDGRVVAFTSDALTENVPYGVSKGALDASSGLPHWSGALAESALIASTQGPPRPGWILEEPGTEISPAGTGVGPAELPQDSANLVAFHFRRKAAGLPASSSIPTGIFSNEWHS